jgi:type IV pilus assembly protein PilE
MMLMNPRPCSPRLQTGLTLVELMVAMAIVAIVTSVAMPSYSAYVQRSRVPEALNALSTFATRMEQRYQDGAGNTYGTAGCALTPANTSYFTLGCALTNGGQGFLVTATGSGQMSGYTYTVNHQGARATPAHPKGANTTCWSMKGTVCDG